MILDAGFIHGPVPPNFLMSVNMLMVILVFIDILKTHILQIQHSVGIKYLQTYLSKLKGQISERVLRVDYGC